jgi:hypothetical protein
MDEATVRGIVKGVLLDDATVKAFAEKLFRADVIMAPDPDLQSNPANPTWAARSYLNRLNANTADCRGDADEILKAINARNALLQQIADAVIPTK